ncbi:hypothetical protein CPPEL_11000 [Corynebacterium pseudopelargi]|uniref:Uncharacterized protein n=1 Tax=Corynebacterium pseudopelargi TaxID=2080757 RepID=A0A3G6IWY6_9CORY|nr:hypothetical protein CPPEL_11000 [Corynebacterium pseudopelargi]
MPLGLDKDAGITIAHKSPNTAALRSCHHMWAKTYALYHPFKGETYPDFWILGIKATHGFKSTD